MIAESYKKQVSFLIQSIPSVAKEKCFAMHGGTAINLFIREMPRLSVDIDLTYIPIEERETTFKNIKIALQNIQADLKKTLHGIRIKGPFEYPGQAKLLCDWQEVSIKIEVNTTMRGVLETPKTLILCQSAQEAFDQFVEMSIVPISQLYGGKVCAALDRQHPRDLFDVKYLLKKNNFMEIKRGFLLCLLSSQRPIYEMLAPKETDQQKALQNQFEGMAKEPFSYEEFKQTRSQLIQIVNESLEENEKQFLLSFKGGKPGWKKYDFSDFERFPALKWKLKNIQKLKNENSRKHQKSYDSLKRQLEL